MNGRKLTRSVSLSTGIVALLWLLAGGAFTPASAQETRDCADFSTREEAQTFYDDHEDDDPNDPDPFDLDTDGDGQACEGLPEGAGATATGSPAASPSPSANALPQNGAATGVMALSGLSLLEAGYGMTLLSKRLGVRRRSVPLYLMRKLIRAAKHGEGTIEVADDLYLVHRSVLENGPAREAPAPVAYEPVAYEPIAYERPADEPSYEPEDDDVSFEAYTPAPKATNAPRPNVYAALARPDALPHDDQF